MEERIITTISIDGNPISTFSNLSIKQSFNNHHFFELYVNLDTFENLGDFQATNSKGHIGKKVLVSITETFSGSETHFSGVICEVAMEQSNGLHGELVLRGYSPTILMDYGPVLNSYLAKTLTDIVKQATSSLVSNDINLSIQPKFTKSINYMVQYKESTFSFLNRLSSEYGEWFYYDGLDTHFGRPQEQKEITLTYGREINTMNWSMKVNPVNFSQYSYNSDNDYLHETDAPSTVGSAQDDNSLALSASQQVFSEKVNLPIKPRVQTQEDLTELVGLRKAAVAADLVGLIAKTSSPAVGIGSVANIKVSKKGTLDFVTEDYGKYLITSILHEVDGNGRYRNTIEAIPSVNDVIPMKKAKYPMAEAQVGIVKQNNDPENFGRVKVELLWQKPLNLTTDWIRVLTPDAGSSDLISQNRGYVFVPEVGDQVIVGFRYNDPNRPFVMGSIFQGKTAAGGLEENHMKTMTTRSGHLLQFNDGPSGQGITITDANKNVIHIDTTGNNITITANENMTLNSKNMQINVAENLDIQVGKDITTMAGNNANTQIGVNNMINIGADYSLNAANITEIAVDAFQSEATNITKTASGALNLNSLEGSITKHAAKTIHNNSGEKSNLF
ncbi:type VI secretion system Vgr family protein [Pedobacter sp. L105]|uniref:type VI secretion system Vgr family protein n=1 Tax=Pedobacter sp. L105 TaxID=1641871 RepID=UPI00131AEC50|nr:phage baseplate assembly protein V [Pedobacter sp. L105]